MKQNLYIWWAISLAVMVASFPASATGCVKDSQESESLERMCARRLNINEEIIEMVSRASQAGCIGNLSMNECSQFRAFILDRNLSEENLKNIFDSVRALPVCKKCVRLLEKYRNIGAKENMISEAIDRIGGRDILITDENRREWIDILEDVGFNLNMPMKKVMVELSDSQSKQVSPTRILLETPDSAGKIMDDMHQWRWENSQEISDRRCNLYGSLRRSSQAWPSLNVTSPDSLVHFKS